VSGKKKNIHELDGTQTKVGVGPAKMVPGRGSGVEKFGGDAHRSSVECVGGENGGGGCYILIKREGGGHERVGLWLTDR